MKIRDHTDEVLREIDRRIKSNLRTSALMVERKAKQLCPVRTGTLKRSIISNWYGAKGSRQIQWPEQKKSVRGKTVRVKSGKTSIPAPTKKQAIVGTNVEYAPYVEMGTKHMTARPYLRPALESCISRIRELFHV